VTIKKTTATYVWLWSDGSIGWSSFAPAIWTETGADGTHIVGTNLISSVPVTEGVFANSDPGQHEVYGESTEKLMALTEEIRRVMTTMSDAAAVEMLQEALDTHGAPDEV
jgi:hypothetical protein